MKLRIPDSEIPKVTRLINLGSAKLAELCTAIESCTPDLRRKPLVDEVAAKVQVDRETVGDIISILLSLYWLREDRGLEPGELARQFIEVAKSVERNELPEPQEGWGSIEAYVIKLLSIDAVLGVTAKALLLALRCQRRFDSARVTTDARPVFAHSASDNPEAFVTIHTLEFGYQEEGEDHQWFLTLGHSDLVQLRKAIDRALEKERSVERLFTASNIRFLSMGEENGDAPT